MNKKGLFQRVSKGAGGFSFRKVTKTPWSQFSSTGWTEAEPRFDGLAAGGARADMAYGSLTPHIPVFIGDAAATPALPERGSPFYGKQGDKEQGDVVIHPLQAGLIQPARVAHPGCVIQGHGLGLYAADKKEHGLLPCLNHGLFERMFNVCQKAANSEIFRSSATERWQNARRYSIAQRDRNQG